MSEPDYLRPQANMVWSTELEIKRSRFICRITRATSEAEARAVIAQARADYPDARHHCSAYYFTVPGANPVERSSDDGEPSGTAGGPMLEQLKGSGLKDLVAVVVRYFGGVKLGAGGLVHAYSQAVGQTLPEIMRVRRALRQRWLLDVPHVDAGRIEAELRHQGIAVLSVAYAAVATLELAILPSQAERFLSLIAELSRGTLCPQEAGETWVETAVS